MFSILLHKLCTSNIEFSILFFILGSYIIILCIIVHSCNVVRIKIINIITFKIFIDGNHMYALCIYYCDSLIVLFCIYVFMYIYGYLCIWIIYIYMSTCVCIYNRTEMGYSYNYKGYEYTRGYIHLNLIVNCKHYSLGSLSMVTSIVTYSLFMAGDGRCIERKRRLLARTIKVRQFCCYLLIYLKNNSMFHRQALSMGVLYIQRYIPAFSSHTINDNNPFLHQYKINNNKLFLYAPVLIIHTFTMIGFVEIDNYLFKLPSTRLSQKIYTYINSYNFNFKETDTT